MNAEAMTAAVKPKLRGVLHQWAAVTALGAGLVLVAMAPTSRAALASGIYALSLLTLLTVSATYHRVTWSPNARTWMRRLDHSSIFVLIAGTYTPIVLVALKSEVGMQLFWIVWGGALLGVLQSLFWINAPKVLTAVLCVALGWAITPYLGAVKEALRTRELVLILAGGIAYTLGAIAYAAKRPNPREGVFGYHEVFHGCTIIGAVFHFAAVASIVRHAT